MIEFYNASPLSTVGHNANQNISYSDIDKYFARYIPTHLHSVAENVSSPRSFKKLKENVAKSFDILNDIFPSIEIITDSGGFTIAQDKYDLKDIDNLIDSYHDFIQSTDIYKDYFTLDVPPCKYITSYQQLEDLNKRSYSLSHGINNGKGIMVCHFHNNSLYKIYGDLFDRYNDHFNRFAVGGVAGGLKNRIIDYALIFRLYIDKMIKFNYKRFPLHILGVGSSPTLLFIFELFKEITKRVYDIDVELTMDSAVHQRLGKARTFTTIYNGIVYQLDYFSKNLHYNFNGILREKYMIEELNKFCDMYDIDYEVKRIYNEDDRMNMEFYVILFLYNNHIYRNIQKIISDTIPTLVDTFLNNAELFYDECLKVLIPINKGRLTKNLKYDARNIIKFCEILMGKDINRSLMLLDRNDQNMFLPDGILKF